MNRAGCGFTLHPALCCATLEIIMNSFQVKESLRLAITTSSTDWSATERHAWIYGIVVGWDEGSLKELKVRFGWSPETIARLRILHQGFVSSDLTPVLEENVRALVEEAKANRKALEFIARHANCDSHSPEEALSIIKGHPRVVSSLEKKGYDV